MVNRMNFKTSISLSNIQFYILCLITILTPMFTDNSNFVYLWLVYAIFLGISVMIMIMKNKLLLFTELRFQVFFLVYCLISNLWAKYTGLQFPRFILLMSIFAICICQCLYTKPDYKTMIHALIIGGIATSCYVLFSNGLANYIESVMSGRRTGRDIMQLNGLGSFTAIVIVLSFGMLITQKHKIFYLFSMLLNLFVLFGAASRMSLFMLISGILVLSYIIFVVWPKKKTIGFIKFILIVALIIYLLWFIMSSLPIFSNILERFTSTLSFFLADSDYAEGTQLRGSLITLGINAFLEHPILGIGYNNARYAAITVIGREMFSHNNYIEILANGGIVAFLIFYIPYMILFYKLSKLLKTKRIEVALAFVMLFMVCIASLAGIPYLQKIYYIYLGFIITIANENIRSIQQNDDKETHSCMEEVS